MASRRLHLGQLFAAAGAGLLVLALFLPWYDLNLSGALLGGSALGQGLGEFGAALQSTLTHAGPVSLTGWQALGTLDVVLAALAAAVAAGVAMSANGALAARPDGAIALAGAAAALLVLYRFTTPPFSGSPLGNDLLQPRSGPQLALLGAVLILAGGLWAASSPAPSRRPRAEAAL